MKGTSFFVIDAESTLKSPPENDCNSSKESVLVLTSILSFLVAFGSCLNDHFKFDDIPGIKPIVSENFIAMIFFKKSSCLVWTQG